VPWTETTRPHDARRGRRSTSDLTDAEGALVAGVLPVPKQTGRPRTTELRDGLDAMLSRAASGCQWAMLPKDFPPPSTVQRSFYDWRDRGVLQTINPPRDGSPRGRPRGFDAGQKVKGRKRPIITDTLGLLVGLVVQAADRQDRDGAPKLLRSIRHAAPWLRHIFADGSSAGPKLKGVSETIGCWTLEIVKRSDAALGFEVLPRRWVIERTFAWLGRCRRLAKDGETSLASAEAWILIAHIRLVTRRIARA